MQFQIHAEALTKIVQNISNIIERRQTNPILSNFLLVVKDNKLELTATDLELEIKVSLPLEHSEQDGAVTVPAKKFTDLCKMIPGQEKMQLKVEDQFARIKINNSRFSLSTMPVDEFPNLEIEEFAHEYQLSLVDFKEMLDRTYFAMAIQDVRMFLNGMLLEFNSQTLRAVATDAHRLAMCDKPVKKIRGADTSQIILPRKGVMELCRLLDGVDTQVTIGFNKNHFRVQLPDMQFTSKLISGNYPEYQRVLPQGGSMALMADRELLRQSLLRTAILSSEKYKGVLLKLDTDMMNIIVINSEQESAEVELAVDYKGDIFEVGFNINYLLDVVNTIKKDQVEFRFIDASSSCLMMEMGNEQCKYVVMPMRV